jgi:hypothetical protein
LQLIQPEIFGAIVLDLSIFLAPRLQKLVKELAAPAVGVTNPAAVSAMLVTGLKGWEAHRPIFERRTLVVQRLQRRIYELCNEAGITDAAEKQGIEDGISRTIGADVLLSRNSTAAISPTWSVCLRSYEAANLDPIRFGGAHANVAG